jgi:outer membrane lipoprotein-sorting protein
MKQNSQIIIIIMKKILIALFLFCCIKASAQQDINVLLAKAKATIESVNDYKATGRMKTNVAFLKVPIANEFTVIDAGTDKVAGKIVRVAKLLPTDDNSDVVLSTVYIDEATSLIKKAKTTTKDNGTYELEMTYSKYASFGLPDKIIFSFNAKDYKLPKGITFDFDDGVALPATDKLKGKKGRAEITFSNYVVNKGVEDTLFK